jgi:hypothetical protein
VLIPSVLACAVLAQSASATAPGRNGRIAFKRYLGPDRSSGAVFTIAPGGWGERQLTSPPVGASDDFPDNASDGSFVAFQRCVDLCQIFTVPTHGGAPVALTPACPPGGFFPECTDSAGPAISPDTGRSRSSMPRVRSTRTATSSTWRSGSCAPTDDARMS